MPPIIVATCCPGANSPPGSAATTPVASMPGTRGNVTPSASPSRVCSSERLRPKALTSIRTQPAAGVGTGNASMCRASGGPGASSTTARMVLFMPSTVAGAFHGIYIRGIHFVAMADPGQLFGDLVRLEIELWDAVDARLRAGCDIGVGSFQILQI